MTNQNSKIKIIPQGYRNFAFCLLPFAFARKRAGFTLVELVVYLGILILLAVGTVRLVLGVSFNAAEVRSERRVRANGELVMEILTREVRQAYDVDASSSVFGTSPGKLVLKTFVSTSSPATTTRSFFLSGTRFARQDGQSPPELVTSQDVTINNLTFWHLSTTTSSLITAKINLEAGQGRFKEEQTFYGSAVLRNKY